MISFSGRFASAETIAAAEKEIEQLREIERLRGILQSKKAMIEFAKEEIGRRLEELGW